VSIQLVNEITADEAGTTCDDEQEKSP
jgi:hypothetical protein